MNRASELSDEAIRTSLNVLRHYSGTWLRDTRMCQDGWDVYFALDADVVRLYLNPDKSPRYGKVFNEPAETQSCLAYLVADYIFQPENGAARGGLLAPERFLIIPPHDEEIRIIMQAIARDAERALVVGRQYYASLSKGFSALSQHEADREKVAEEFQNNARGLISLSNEIDGYLDAQDRLANLSPQTLTNIWNARTADGAFLLETTELELWSNLRTDRIAWYDLLTKHRPVRQSRQLERWDTNENDAQVLAVIDYVNDALYERRVRLNLVTGSAALFAAGREYISNRRYNCDTRLNFADSCLRNPLWIMADSEFFAPIRADASLKKWLDLLSPERDNLSEASRMEKVEREELQKIPGEWRALVELLTTTKYGSKSIAGSRAASTSLPMIDRLAALATSGDLTLDIFMDLFERPITQSLSRLYLSSTWIGLLDSVSMSQKRSALMPALQFDFSYNQFNQYYTKLLALFGGSADPATRRERIVVLKQLNEDINSPDGDTSLYHSHVIHGAAYAAKGLWEPALTLCAIAIRIADQLVGGNEKDERRGREAAFLAAVICRRSARNVNDLSQADMYLEEATQRENPGAPLDIRFESERAAISIRRIYFDYFVHASAPNRAGFVRRCRESIAQLEEIVDRVKERSIHGMYADTSGKQIKMWVMRQCYTNIFDLALILLNEDDRFLYREESVRLFSELNSSIAKQDERRDPHAWLVCRIVALLLFPEDESVNPHPRTEIVRRIDAIVIDAPYEEGRRDMFRRVLAG